MWITKDPSVVARVSQVPVWRTCRLYPAKPSGQFQPRLILALAFVPSRGGLGFPPADGGLGPFPAPAAQSPAWSPGSAPAGTRRRRGSAVHLGAGARAPARRARSSLTSLRRSPKLGALVGGLAGEHLLRRSARRRAARRAGRSTPRRPGCRGRCAGPPARPAAAPGSRTRGAALAGGAAEPAWPRSASASPKSVIWRRRSGAISMFSGLMSRCTSPRRGPAPARSAPRAAAG